MFITYFKQNSVTGNSLGYSHPILNEKASNFRFGSSSSSTPTPVVQNSKGDTFILGDKGLSKQILDIVQNFQKMKGELASYSDGQLGREAMSLQNEIGENKKVYEMTRQALDKYPDVREAYLNYFVQASSLYKAIAKEQKSEKRQQERLKKHENDRVARLQTRSMITAAPSLPILYLVKPKVALSNQVSLLLLQLQ
jgi:hypothetical protein